MDAKGTKGKMSRAGLEHQGRDDQTTRHQDQAGEQAEEPDHSALNVNGDDG